MNCEELLIEIGNKCEGLTYISETDAKVDPFELQRNDLSPSGFLQAIGKPPFTAIEQEAFDDFFEPLLEKEGWYDMYFLLANNLTETTVFRVGQIEIDIYAVGLFDNHIVGIKTFSVET